ncbi:MAG: MBL fold metallo-hydrolase, partial [Gammaproteobacteria bacterium]|nr:MBL fold metallo-hydrolase [Gammaproteobacteria bacterium]
WGHGTFDSSIRAAREAGVKSAYLTHHEPTRSDDALEKIFAEALERNQVGEGDPQFYLAREGLRVEL